MKSRLTAFVFLASCIFLVAACNRPADFTGFWKVNCTDAFGVQIKKQSGNLFSVSFCGPGGCFAPGKWMPNTPIIGDSKYRVVNPTTILSVAASQLQRRIGKSQAPRLSRIRIGPLVPMLHAEKSKLS